MGKPEGGGYLNRSTQEMTMARQISLNFVQKGDGTPLVLVPGWSQTSRFFQKQIDGLSDSYRVIAPDMRGHGESPKPKHGYRIATLARDLREFLQQHGLTEVVLAGHSMGASIIWSYLEQFGAERIAKLIFIDQAPLLTNGGELSGDKLLQAGAVFTPETLYATASNVVTNQRAAVRAFRPAFFSNSISEEDVILYTEQSLKMPAQYAAKLLIDHGAQDWRDVIQYVIPKLSVPTLVVAGELATIVPSAAASWIAAQIPSAKLSIFSAAELGSHFMFWENASKFNAVLRDFIG